MRDSVKLWRLSSLTGDIELEDCGNRLRGPPGESHFGDLTAFGVHPLGCLAPANTLKRGHQTGLEHLNERC